MKTSFCWLVGLALVGFAASAGVAADPAGLERKVTWNVPRCSLTKALESLSGAAKIRLIAAPSLSEEQLDGLVPNRSVRETMDGLAELFDARWSPLRMNAGGFRLEPIPAKAVAAKAARDAYLVKLRKALDQESAEALKEAKNAGPPGDAESRERTRKFGMVLWAVLPSKERNKVLRGTPYTYSLPLPAAKPVYQMLLGLTEKDNQPLVGPALITYDLDEKGENMLPQLRARMTAMRQNSIIGAFGVLDLTSIVPLPAPKPGDASRAGDVKFPATLGESGRFVGTRDELLIKFAEGSGVPVLSRHRSLPDSTYGVNAANRTAGEVVNDLARQCEATGSVTKDGFWLLRSNSEVIDSLYYPTTAVVARYLKSQPSIDKHVPFETVAPLAALSPIQLKVLQRSNTCTEEAEFAYDCYGLLRFYNALTPQQRLKLFSAGSAVKDSGLDFASLSHAALHAFLDERTKRGDLNIYGELQEIAGLRLLFIQKPDQMENTFVTQGIRGEVKTTATRELAQVNQEEKPTAK